MVTVPNYNKPMQEGIYQHFKKISENTTLPIIMYNIPSRCGVNMNHETVVRLYKDYENIKAIKEASGSLSQIQDIMNKCNIMVFAGDDAQLLPVMALGGCGVISVLANINPAIVMDTFEYCKFNNYEEARKNYFIYHNKINELFKETNPIPIKRLMSENGMLKQIYRLPLL